MPKIHVVSSTGPSHSVQRLRKFWTEVTEGPDIPAEAEVVIEPYASVDDIRATQVMDALPKVARHGSVSAKTFCAYKTSVFKRPAPAIAFKRPKLAPPRHDSLISPAHQKIIQIDITNACPKSCSNCTRFCGHFKDPFFMSVKQFKKAVDSLQGFGGMVGVMGGEPTLHPDFEEMIGYLNEMRPDPPAGSKVYSPFVSWGELHNDILRLDRRWRKGLWTALGPGFVKHHELIMDSFRYMCVNDHKGGCSHAALLMPRKDLGIPDDQWEKYRNSCWIQHQWSASVNHRGAYFCEVAAALADLFDGPDGWPVEPGWWCREMKDFGEQLEMCEYCSACLPVPTILDAENTDLVTPAMAERLKGMGSGKKVRVVNDTWEQLQSRYKAIDSSEPYTEGSDMIRVHDPNGLNVGKITAVIVCRDYDDYLSATLPRTVEEFSRVIVITSPEDEGTKAVANRCGAELVVTDVLSPPSFRKGAAINDVLATLPKRSWVLVTDADIMYPRGWGKRMSGTCLNPGALYYVQRRGPRLVKVEEARATAEYALKHDDWKAVWEYIGENRYEQHGPLGYCQLFNIGSSAIRTQKSLYPMASVSAEFDDDIFSSKWYTMRKCVYMKELENIVLHLPHGEARLNWQGRKSPRIDKPLPVTLDEATLKAVGERYPLAMKVWHAIDEGHDNERIESTLNLDVDGLLRVIREIRKGAQA